MTGRVFLSAWLVLLVVAWWGTGCGVGPTPLAAPIETNTPQLDSAGRELVSEGIMVVTSEAGTQEEAAKTPTSAPEPTPVEVLAGGEEAVRLAIEDLVKRLGVAVEGIEAVSVEAVEWTDASLGCPQPGMMYAQVITPGFLVVLEAGGEQYEYHTDTGRVVLLCENEKALGETPSKGLDPTVKDGGPNQTRDDDVIIAPPSERK